jgi:hypothetical protein
LFTFILGAGTGYYYFKFPLCQGPHLLLRPGGRAKTLPPLSLPYLEADSNYQANNCTFFISVYAGGVYGTTRGEIITISKPWAFETARRRQNKNPFTLLVKGLV